MVPRQYFYLGCAFFKHEQVEKHLGTTKVVSVKQQQKNGWQLLTTKFYRCRLTSTVFRHMPGSAALLGKNDHLNFSRNLNLLPVFVASSLPLQVLQDSYPWTSCPIQSPARTGALWTENGSVRPTEVKTQSSLVWSLQAGWPGLPCYK